jgi:cyclophilin family peptidyl-prolyl cis-trans isomerase
MASAGLDTGASQFIVTLKESPQLNGRCVAFGRLVNGEETLKAIEEVYTVRSAPARTITIADCGLVEE